MIHPMERADVGRAIRLAGRTLLRARETGVWDGGLPIDPLPMLKACRDTQVMTVQAAQERLTDLLIPLDVLEGLTIRGERAGRPHYLVIYGHQGNMARRRFSIAHELGHRVLAHAHLNGTTHPREEAEANAFASALLCPTSLLLLMGEALQPLFLEQVAWVCGISPAAAKVAWDGRSLPTAEDGHLMAALRPGWMARLQKIPAPKPCWQKIL